MRNISSTILVLVALFFPLPGQAIPITFGPMADWQFQSVVRNQSFTEFASNLRDQAWRDMGYRCRYSCSPQGGGSSCRGECGPFGRAQSYTLSWDAPSPDSLILNWGDGRSWEITAEKWAQAGGNFPSWLLSETAANLGLPVSRVEIYIVQDGQVRLLNRRMVPVKMIIARADLSAPATGDIPLCLWLSTQHTGFDQVLGVSDDCSFFGNEAAEANWARMPWAQDGRMDRSAR